jgi:hypothetical protein
MPITRTPIIDDDGTGLTGTPLDNAWKQEFYNQIDNAISVGGPAVVTYETRTGTIHNVALGAQATLHVVNCANSADLTITGFQSTPVARDGDLLLVAAYAAGVVYLAHNNAGSAVGNQLFNMITAPTPLRYGRALYYYYSGAWRIVSHLQGSWITPGYSAGWYQASAGSWTVEAGDQIDYAYYLNGTILFFTGYVAGSSLSASPGNLAVSLPAGYSISRNIGNIPLVMAPAGANEIGLCGISPGSQITFWRVSGNFVPTTNVTYLSWNLAIPLG